MNRRSVVLFVIAASVGLAQDPRQIVEEVQHRSMTKSQRYEGSLEVIDARAKVSTKRWEYIRIGSFGDSKSVLRFTSPAEVKGVALLVHSHPDRASDQWMWRPAIERDQRIALQDRSTRFFGTDFSYEDLEERDVNQFDFKYLGEDTIENTPCYKLEATPREKKASQYTKSILWVTKDHYLYMLAESYNKMGIVRHIRYFDFENIQGIWTARGIEVTDMKTKSRTIMKLEKLQYNMPLKEEDFTLQALRRAS
jgi:Outer membrane lipoprotein-sorting protein